MTKILDLVDKYKIVPKVSSPDLKRINANGQAKIIAHYSNYFGTIFLTKPNRIYLLFSGLSDNLKHTRGYTCFGIQRIKDLKHILELEKLEGFEICDEEAYTKFKESLIIRAI